MKRCSNLQKALILYNAFLRVTPGRKNRELLVAVTGDEVVRLLFSD